MIEDEEYRDWLDREDLERERNQEAERDYYEQLEMEKKEQERLYDEEMERDYYRQLEEEEVRRLNQI